MEQRAEAKKARTRLAQGTQINFTNYEYGVRRSVSISYEAIGYNEIDKS